MATLLTTPISLGRISNEKYKKEDKWRIDDIALGPANELLISGHNLEIPITFISMYKEDSVKYDNRPEFNRNFRQPQPGEQLVLFLEGNSTIGLKVESALRLVSIKGMVILKTLTWKRSPTCVCFYRGKLYAASSSTNIVSVCNLDSEEKSDIVLSDLGSDCVFDMVVVMEKIYVCTKVAGRALVFSMTGSKELEFKNVFQSDAKTTSICIHERTELVFVSWSNFQIRLYSQETGKCLRTFYMTEELHKIRVTTENILVTLSASKCIVAVYDVGEAIKFGEFKKNILSSVKKKHRSNVEELIGMKELYMKQLEENENLRRQHDRDVQKLQERMKKLDEEKGKVEKEIKTLRHEKKELQKEKDATLPQKQLIRREMEAEKTKGEINKTVFMKVLASQEEENLKLQKENEHLIERLSTMESETISQGEVIKIGEFEKTIPLSVKKKHRKKLMSHDAENFKYHRANSETNTSMYFPLKSASKQSKVEKLRNTKELYLKQLEENETLRRESDRDIQGLQERMKKLEVMKNELISQQKTLKDNMDEEKGKVEKEIKTLLHEKKELQKEKDATLRQKQQIRREMEDEKTKGEINKTVFMKVLAGQEEENLKLQKVNEFLISKNEAISQEMLPRFLSDAEPDNVSSQRVTAINSTDELESGIAESVDTGVLASQEEENLKLQKEKEYLIGRLSTRESEAISQEMLPRFPSDAEPDNVSSQSVTAINGTDELESVIAESVDTGVYSSSSISTSHFENLRVANGEQLNPDLKVAVTLTARGAHMHIPDTGVELDIPRGAVRHKQLIEVTIIPFDKQFAPIKNFSSNSSVVVELLPNKARFSVPVYLKLPHCLQLKGNYKDNKNPVKVFVSHHEAGPPVWKEDSSAKCTLEEDHCVIRLKHFCWVKYEINDKIVVAKRLKVFTAGKSIHANDNIAEIEVGYHMDLPGRVENMSAIRGMDVYQTKPFVFVKQGKVPLQLVLSKIIPKEWTYITPDENPKVISYKSIADDKDTSCPFVLEKSRSSKRSPYCIFKIVQGNESVELSMRFEFE